MLPLTITNEQEAAVTDSYKLSPIVCPQHIKSGSSSCYPIGLSGTCYIRYPIHLLPSAINNGSISSVDLIGMGDTDMIKDTATLLWIRFVAFLYCWWKPSTIYVPLTGFQMPVDKLTHEWLGYLGKEVACFRRCWPVWT